MTWYPLDGQFADLVNTAPDPTAGRPAGIGDWRLVVEAVLPASPGGYWDLGAWDAADWNVLSWVDITEHVRGISTRRGADEPYGRPRTGTGTITVESPGDLFSPWNQATAFGDAFAFFAPGTLVRVGLVSATDTRAGGWLPIFAGTVELWPVAYSGAGADRWCDVQLVETAAELAGLTGPSAPVPEGDDDRITDRATRVLDRYGWRYGLEVTAGNRNEFGIAATAYTLAALDELLAAADAADVEIRSSPTGALQVAARHHTDTIDHQPSRLAEFSTDLAGVEHVGIGDRAVTGDLVWLAYDADAFVTGNDITALVNSATWTGPSDLPQTYSVIGSSTRWQPVTGESLTVPAMSDAQVLELVTRYVERRARNLLRVDDVTISADRPNPVDGLLVVAAIDLGDPCTVTPPGVDPADIDTGPNITGHVRAIGHDITPAGPGSVVWRTSLAIDTGTVNNMLGAQL
jgi:hypothetical protein